MRNNTYIHIRRGANSLGKEQKFPCEGIGISLRGNWNFLVRGFMRHAAGLRALGLMLVLMGLGASWNGVWGQYEKYTINPTLPTGGESALSGSTEIIYAMPGKDKPIYFQFAYVPDNLNGFIWWRMEDGSYDLLEKSSALSNSGYSDQGNTLQVYKNGYAWFRNFMGRQNTAIIEPEKTNERSIPASACMITYKTPSDFTEATVICDASSLMNYSYSEKDKIITAPLTTIRRTYVIKDATERQTTFNEFRTTVSEWEGGSNWLTNTDANIPQSFLDNKASFPENYEIHTPMVSDDGTSYRLAQILSNYYVGISKNPAKHVRWRMYKQDGTLATGTANRNKSNGVTVLTQTTENFAANRNDNPANIISYKFDYDDTDKQQVFYITAEVSNDKDTWYPVSLLTVYLEPNVTPVTKNILEQTSEYEYRTQKYIEERYVEVARQDFDFDVVEKYENVNNGLSADTNYPNHPLVDAQSYYAYAYPHRYENRVHKLRSVGSGEYGIYRTLNYSLNGTDISDVGWYTKEPGYKYSSDSQYFSFNYQAWFTNNYNYYITDRLFDEEGKYGYFLYVDAADEAGIITRLNFSETLCPNTRLVVTAWVCSMSENQDGRTDADLGLTFKGVMADDTEVILHKFYTGSVTCNPDEDNGYSFPVEKANWQQVYFSFNFSAEEDTYKNFILEIANNCRHSDGADYAIDDIRVYRSLPDINVIREDECDASTLTISSDYETILRNMDWVENEDIANVDLVSSDASLLRYRFGLQGEVGEEGYPNIDKKVGNTYFSFLEGLYQDEDKNWISGERTDVTTTNAEGILADGTYRWIRINKNLVNFSAQSAYSLRVAVWTDPKELPNDYEAAQRLERILNLRALNDYNYAVEHWDEIAEEFKTDAGGTVERPSWLGNDPIETTLTESMLSNEEISDETLKIYSEDMQKLYKRLLIPRIRVPWYEDGILYLSRVDVTSTDLRTEDEIIGYDSNGNQILADGHYQVILFGALQVHNGVTGDDYMHAHDEFLKNGRCNLISDFYVGGTIRIRVTAEDNSTGLICEGTQRHVEAELLNKDTREPLSEDLFGFDWFLGTMTEYEALTESGMFGNNVDLASAIKQYREDTSDDDSFRREDVLKWSPSGANAKMKEGLLAVFDDERDLLRRGVSDFTLILDSESIVAMPYVKQSKNVDNNLYCTEVKEVFFDEISTEIPEIHPGLPNITYGELTQVPLRLGLRHVENGKSLTIPLQEEIAFAVSGTTGHSLIMTPTNKTIILEGSYNGEDLPAVAQLDALSVVNNSDQNHLKLTFNRDFDFREGESYTLLIPFSESADESTVLGSACDGLARLVIRIVPEYLTWKGTSADKWYVDSKWNQSSEGELYMFDDTDDDDDANGTDEDLTRAFSPLYFTKITLPVDEKGNGSQLVLEQPTYMDGGITLGNPGTGATIQYEMAIDTLATNETGYMEEQKLTIRPYYINKVDQIYFKPNATLLNQHHLDYQKAWVEFEMANMEKRWMASPLQNVYAGDIYAPTGDTYKGRQETPAFTDISYSKDLNSRWAPAFYQKAWNHDVSYSEVEGTPTDDQIATVKAVKNNWSIEYNDVTVKYPIGKGFYLSVEDVPGEGTALVRLPKADVSYKYEKPLTKALNATTRTEKAGRLAELDPDASEDVYIIQLDEAYNNGDYYLIGNPAMAYLKMEGDDGFLQENGITKYWTYQEGTFSATVDNMTDEDAFERGQSNGYIAPMQAFFIEWPDTKGDDETTVTFAPDMFVSKPEDLGTESVAYNAFNPTLTLTAERGDQRSVAKLATREDAHDGYEASEDAIALIDSELDVPVVYTVAGTAAAQVNALQAIRNVGLGVYNEAGGEVTVAIEGMSQLTEPLYLYDAKTRKSVELVGDRYELTVDGESHGRYFLRSGLSTDNDQIHTGDDISIYSLRPGEIVATTVGTPLRSVRVYGIDGDLVTQQSLANQTAYRLNVPRGAIYVVYAEDMDGIIRNVKLRVR